MPPVFLTGQAVLPDDADRSVTRLSKPFMQTHLERALKVAGLAN